MGDITVGDTVFDSKGNPTAVIGKSSVWKDRELFEVTTDDGQTVVADASHDWVVRLCRKRKVVSRRSTAYLYERQRYMSDFRAPAIAPHGALNLPNAELPIDPYVLGIWLGDGNTRQSSITTADSEVIEHLDAAEGLGKEYRQGTARHVRIGPNYRDAGVSAPDTLQARLRNLNVLGNKHIPALYLRAGQGQRLALLQGLIDSDGYVADDGQVEFCSTSRRLAEQTRELVHSLGVKASLCLGRATLNGRDCGPKYRVMFYMAGCARLTRKARKTKDGTKQPGRYIRIQPAGRGDTVCIQVAAESGMFLAGRGMVATHNSELVSKYLPAWFLGSCENAGVIICSYEADFAASWSAKARDVLVEHGKLFGVQVHRGHQAPKSGWTIAGTSGICHSAGCAGPVTGKGCSLLVLDDVVKNAEQAYSPTYREKAYDWYRSTAYTRLEPGGSIVVCATRWHEADLSGRILDESEEDWTVINLPAVAEGPDSLGRQEGDALWPERFNHRRLGEIQQSIGPYWWSALYQGQPSTPEGAIFRRKSFRYAWRHAGGWMAEREDGTTVFHADHQCLRVQTIDTALKAGDQNDWTVILTALITSDGSVIVEDVDRQRLEVPDQYGHIKRAYKRRRPAFIGIEDKASGTGLIQKGKREGLPVRALRANTDKFLRAQPVATMLENERVYFNVNGSWLEDFETELVNFPVGTHDDQVDVLAYAGLLASERALVIGPGHDPEPVPDTLGPLKRGAPGQKALPRTFDEHEHDTPRRRRGRIGIGG